MALGKHDDWVNIYENFSHPKVVLQVKNEEMLTEIYENAKLSGLPHYIVVTNDLIIGEPSTKTVVGIGPGRVKSPEKFG